MKVELMKRQKPPVVRIIDEWPFSTKRPDAEILADTILRQETEDFYFDIAQRNHLIGEIEGVLSLSRAAYPPDESRFMPKIRLSRECF